MSPCRAMIDLIAMTFVLRSSTCRGAFRLGRRRLQPECIASTDCDPDAVPGRIVNAPVWTLHQVSELDVPVESRVRVREMILDSHRMTSFYHSRSLHGMGFRYCL